MAQCAPHGAPQEGQLRHLRRLRHPDRLGDGHLRRLPEGGRRATASRSRPRRGHPAASTRSSSEIEGGSYELYAEVLRRTAVRIAKEHRLAARALARRASCPTRSQRWTPFKETNPQLDEVRQEVPDRARSRTSTTSCSARRAATSRTTSTSSSPRSRCAPTSPTRRTSRSARAASARKKGWVHVAAELLPRRRAVPEGEGPGHLGQPPQGGARARRRRSRPPRSRRSSRRPSCSARRSASAPCASSRSTRTSSSPRRAIWQTTCTRRPRRRARRSSIDSPVLPGRARGRCRRCSSRPASRSAACSPRTATGTTCSAGSPSPAPRSACAETTAARLTGEPGAAAARAARVRRRALRRARRGRWRSARSRRCRCPGTLERRRARARAAPDRRPHRRRHGDLGRRGRACSSCGDYLSPVEIPMLSRGRLARRLPRDARAPARRSSSRPSTSSPATARRSTPRARAGDPARGRALPGDRLGAAAHAADRRAADDRRREPPAGRRSSLKPTSPR